MAPTKRSEKKERQQVLDLLSNLTISSVGQSDTHPGLELTSPQFDKLHPNILATDAAEKSVHV
jgi:hypothetical protein